MEEKFKKCIAAVEEAGKIAFDHFDSGNIHNEVKRDKTVVTEADKGVESEIISFIEKEFPGDAIRGEEHGEKPGTTGIIWHIDPIDGTDNFLRKIPFCAISVARLSPKTEESFAIIHNPVTRQTFSTMGEEAGEVYENGRPCLVTSEPLGASFAVGMGFSSSKSWMKPAAYAIQKALGLKYGRCRSHGCASLEAAYVAANRLDAFITAGLKSWDYAAGLLLAKAAGATIQVFENGAWSAWDGKLIDLCETHEKTIFVSHADIQNDMLAIIGNPEDWAKA